MAYELFLKNDKIKFYNRLTVFIFILNAVLSAYFFFASYDHINKNTAGFTALVLQLLFILLYLTGIKKEAIFLTAAFCTVAYWTLIGYWWIGLVMLLLFVLFKTSLRILKVYVSAEKILYPSFPNRTIRWQELHNVVLKDQLLTIDFKNNTIIQQLTDGRIAVNEIEFNEFCKKQLS